MGDRGFDDEIMELELDDELFSSPSPKTPPGRPATMTRANPLASLGGPLPKIGGASNAAPTRVEREARWGSQPASREARERQHERGVILVLTVRAHGGCARGEGQG